MGVEPGVDALDVEGVLALGEEAQDLLRLELVQAHGAFEAVLVAAQRREAEHGEGLDDLPIDPGIPRRCRGGIGVAAPFAMLHIQK